MRAVKFHNGIPVISRRGRKPRNTPNVSTCMLPKINQLKKVKSKILPPNADIENTLLSKMSPNPRKEKKTTKNINKKPNKNDTVIKNSLTKNDAAIKNIPNKNDAAVKNLQTKNYTGIKNSPTIGDTAIKNRPTKNDESIRNSPTKSDAALKNSPSKNDTTSQNSPTKNDASIKNSPTKRDAAIKNSPTINDAAIKKHETIKNVSLKNDTNIKNSLNKNNTVIKNAVNQGKDHTANPDDLKTNLNEQVESVKDPFTNHRHGITVILKENGSTEVQPLSPETKKSVEKAANKNSCKNDVRPKNLGKPGNQEKLNKTKSLCVRIDNPDNLKKETSEQSNKKPKNVFTDLVKKKKSLTGMQCCEPKPDKKIIICTKTNYQKLHQKQQISKIKKKIRRMNFQALCMVEEINKKLMVDNKKMIRNKLENFNEEIRKMNLKNSSKKARPALPFHCVLREKIVRIDNEIRQLQKESHPKCRKFKALPKTHLQTYAF